MSKRWTETELEMLQSMAGDLPWPMLLHQYNRWASVQDWPNRTEIALLRKCSRLRLSRRAVGNWVTTGMISEMLGISRVTTRRWIEDGWIRSIRYSCMHFVHRHELCRLARERPYLFGGLSRSLLVQLLDSAEVADWLIKLKLPRFRQSKPVYCVETGQRFESIGRAARKAFISVQGMHRAIHRQRPIAGFNWRFI